MNLDAIDVLAATNAALCSMVIYHFAAGYERGASSPPHVALTYLPIPIALSSEFAETFASTSVATGLGAWTRRNPAVLIDLPGEVEGAVPITRQALLFGLQRGVLAVVDGNVLAQPRGLKRPPPKRLTEPTFVVASRFGEWCGQMKSPKMVFITLGIRP